MTRTFTEPTRQDLSLAAAQNFMDLEVQACQKMGRRVISAIGEVETIAKTSPFVYGIPEKVCKPTHHADPHLRMHWRGWSSAWKKQNGASLAVDMQVLKTF